MWWWEWYQLWPESEAHQRALAGWKANLSRGRHWDFLLAAEKEAEKRNIFRVEHETIGTIHLTITSHPPLKLWFQSCSYMFSLGRMTHKQTLTGGLFHNHQLKMESLCAHYHSDIKGWACKRDYWHQSNFWQYSTFTSVKWKPETLMTLIMDSIVKKETCSRVQQENFWSE